MRVEATSAGVRGIAALVAAIGEGARLRLLHVVHGDDAVADRELVVQRQIHQAACTLAADIVVVRGLAANDASQGNVAVVLAALLRRGQGDRAWNFEGARHMDQFGLRAVLLDFFRRPADQRIGDIGIVRRRHDQDARTLDARDRRSRGRCLRPGRHDLGLRAARHGLLANHLQTETFETDNALLAVGQQHHLLDPEVDQDLRADADLARQLVQVQNEKIAALCAETAALARPSLTASRASHMLDFQRPLRKA